MLSRQRLSVANGYDGHFDRQIDKHTKQRVAA